MAAAEMPFSAASFLKSASQRSKLTVVRQLALCATAGAGRAARRHATGMAAIRIAATGIQLETAVQAEIVFRIGMSAVVGGIVTAPWRAGKPCRRNACPQRCPQRLL